MFTWLALVSASVPLRLDEYHQAATPASRTSAVSATPWLRTRGRRARIGVALSAVANAPAVPNRSAGVLESAWVMAASSAGGTLRSVPSRGIGSMNRLAMIAWAVGPVYGGSPASISYTTHARLYWSLRPSSLGSALDCSGLM